MSVEVFAASVRQFAGRSGEALQKLSTSRREKALSYRMAADRDRSLAAALLMRRVLGTDDVRRTAYGQPFLPGARPFSLSHAGEWAVLAVADAPVGVDLEPMRPENFEGLARVAFHETEREMLAASQDPQACFFDLWTMKESYLKAIGLGFALTPKRVSLTRGDDPRVAGDERARFVRLTDFPGFAAAVCVLGTPGAPRVLFLNDLMAD